MEIQEKEDWRITRMKQRVAEGGSQSNPYSPTIYRVPETIRICDKAAYEPEVISIGPYHWGKEQLTAMENHKWRYLHDFLSRNTLFSLDIYLEEVKKLEERARGCYSEKTPLDSVEFTQMMVLDGCFVIELFLKVRTGKAARGDLIYSRPWVMESVARDLFLLENQLPFFILESLYGKLKEGVSDPPSLFELPLVNIALHFFSWLIEWDRVSAEKVVLKSESVDHLLNLIHSHLFPPLNIPSSLESLPSSGARLLTNSRKSAVSPYLSYFPDLFEAKKAQLLPTNDPPKPKGLLLLSIPSATSLKDVGVTFTRKRNPKSVLDITFNSGSGKMEIPRLVVEDRTNTYFRNLLAFEQCLPFSSGFPFTTYVRIMDCLVNTAKDVEILRSAKRGIIENGLGSDEELASLFNSIRKGLVRSKHDDHLWQVMKEVRVYSETTRHVQRAILMRDYFGSPWSFISVLAAAFLILFTFLQTLYAILSYSKG